MELSRHLTSAGMQLALSSVTEESLCMQVREIDNTPFIKAQGRLQVNHNIRNVVEIVTR